MEIQRTAGGELVALQDLGLARTTDVEEVFPGRAPWRVGDFTLAELRQLAAGSWFGAEYAGEKIPTLDEVIGEVGYRHGLVIDVVSPARYPGLEADIVDELQSNWHSLARALVFDNLVVQSTDAGSMSTFHDVAPYVPVGVVYNYRPADADLAAVSEWADHVGFFHSRVDQALVEVVHDVGLDITVHTVSTEDLMSQFVDLRVDGIVTDRPAVLDDVLD